MAKDIVEKNLEIACKQIAYLLSHPEKIKELEDKSHIIFLPLYDKKLSKANEEKARRIEKEEGIKVKRYVMLTPEDFYL